MTRERDPRISEIFYYFEERVAALSEGRSESSKRLLSRSSFLRSKGDKAILGFDPPSPLLQLCPDLKALKQKAHIAYQSRYGLPVELSKIVKHADLVLLATEKRDLMLAEPAPWLPMPDPLPHIIHPWQNPYARFINRWRELAKAVGYNGPE